VSRDFIGAEFIAWLEVLRDSGADRIEGSDTIEPAWPANLAVIIAKAKEALEPKPWTPTDAEMEEIVLRSVLGNGKRRLGLNPDFDRHAHRLGNEGLLVAHDRLGERLELTPAGHRRLAAISPDYEAPAGLYVADRWHDPAALVCQAAYLLGPGQRYVQPVGGTDEVSPECKAALEAEWTRQRAVATAARATEPKRFFEEAMSETLAPPETLERPVPTTNGAE
jgi:hypothetical protein